MSRIKRLLRLRKQDDCVKLALLLFLAASWLLYGAVTQGLAYARLQAQPVEYVLESGVSGAVLEVNMQQLQTLDGVLGVSRQREFPITVGNRPLTVTALERQYLTNCCKINVGEAANQYWLNAEAFAALFGNAASPVRLTYQRESRTESGDFFLLPGLAGEGAYAVTTGNTATLGDAATLRVMFEHGDLSGADMRAVQELGFTVCNQAELQRRGFETELALTKFTHALLSALFASIAGAAFLKCSKEKKKNRMQKYFH